MSSDDPSLPAQLDDLRRHWSFAYDIAFDIHGRWHARHVTAGVIMDADTAAELDDMIGGDYRERRDRER